MMMRIFGFAIVILGILSLGVLPATSQIASILFADVTVTVSISTDAPDWGYVAVADIDGDGWDDLLINRHPGVHFYRNNRNGTFSRVTPTGIPPASEATKHRHIFAFCDLDGDGSEDLIIGTGIRGPDEVDPHQAPRTSEDVWLRNVSTRGVFAFQDMTATWGTKHLGSNVHAIGCLDADRNGRLDVIVMDSQTFNGAWDVTFPLYALFMNRLPAGFVNEYRRIHAEPETYPTREQIVVYSVDCGDLARNDGVHDCIVGSNQHSRWVVQGIDAYRDPLYFPADGTFYVSQDFPEHLGDLRSYNYEIAVADFNGDRRLDIVRMELGPAVSINCGQDTQGGGAPLRECFRFEELPRRAHNTTVAVGDFDNDGDVDMFVARFGTEAIDGVRVDAADWFFRNDGNDAAGNPRFSIVDVGLAGPFVGRQQFDTGAGAATVIDYDKDGRLDLVIGYTEASQLDVHRRPILLYRNVSPPGNAWVGFILRAPVTLGTWVEVQACARRQVTQLSARSGWLSQDSRNVHFGLGSCREAPRVTIRWPDGSVSTGVVPANAYHTVPPLPNPGPGPTPTPGPTPPQPTPTPPPPTPVPTPTRTPKGDRPPRVQIVSEVRAVSVEKPVWIVALAADDRGIRSVTFDVDGVQLPPARSSVTPPYYAAMWDPRDRRWASGWHTVTVTVMDTAGQIARDSLRLFLRR